MMLYTAGEAAKILGIPVSTVRYYDKAGRPWTPRNANHSRAGVLPAVSVFFERKI